MVARDERILVLADDAELAGPTLLLLRLLRWMRAHTQLEFEVLVRRDGPSRVELQRECRVRVVAHGPDPCRPAGRRRWRRALDGIDVATVYVATPRALDLVELVPGDAPVLCAVTEPGAVLEQELGDQLDARLRTRVDRWVAADEGVGAWLEPRVHAPVLVQSELVLVEGPPIGTDDAAPTPLVVGWGPLSWDGGADRFVDLACACRAAGLGARWVWTGGRPQDPRHAAIVEDVACRSLEGVVQLEPDDRSVVQPQDASLFVATARRAVHPLGALEAARRGVPVVGLAGAGVQDVAVEDGLVDDLEHLEDVVLGLLADEVRRRRRGREAAKRTGDLHHVDRAAPRLLAALAPWLDPEGRLSVQQVDGG